MKGQFRSNMHFNKDLIVGSELYDYKKDPDETVNVAEKKEYAAILKKLKKNMQGYLDAEYKKLNNAAIK